MKKGFSLVEMLIVISIVALISSFILARLTLARANARDSERVESVRQLKTALALYEHSRSIYPVCNPEIIINGTSDCLSTALVGENVMGVTPLDPLGGSSGACGGANSYVYCYVSGDGKSYTIRYHLETDSIKPSGWYSETP